MNHMLLQMFHATVQDNFGMLARNVFHSLPRASVVHFVTDSYRRGSIKDVE